MRQISFVFRINFIKKLPFFLFLLKFQITPAQQSNQYPSLPYLFICKAFILAVDDLRFLSLRFQLAAPPLVARRLRREHNASKNVNITNKTVSSTLKRMPEKKIIEIQTYIEREVNKVPLYPFCFKTPKLESFPKWLYDQSHTLQHSQVGLPLPLQALPL